MGRVRTLSLYLSLALYLSISIYIYIFFHVAQMVVLSFLFLLSRLYCHFSPDSVENKAPGCPWETCYGEYPYNSVLQLGMFYIAGCYSEQCFYAGFDERLIWTSKETVRRTRCGRFKFSLTLNTARSTTVSMTFCFSFSATACRLSTPSTVVRRDRLVSRLDSFTASASSIPVGRGYALKCKSTGNLTLG